MSKVRTGNSSIGSSLLLFLSFNVAIYRFSCIQVKSTLHQIVRDWSIEGMEEREESYGLILKELLTHMPVTVANRNMQRILVPGAGLGRYRDCAISVSSSHSLLSVSVLAGEGWTTPSLTAKSFFQLSILPISYHPIRLFYSHFFP
jgi:hypothetical protein